jgi:hypothetical protein
LGLMEVECLFHCLSPCLCLFAFQLILTTVLRKLDQFLMG